MITSGTSGMTLTPALPSHAEMRRIRFVPDAAGQDVLLELADPQRTFCVSTKLDSTTAAATTGEGFDVLIIADHPKDHLSFSDDLLKWAAATAALGAPPPIAVTLHGAQIIWGLGRVVIVAAPDRVEPFLLALADFSHHERQLRKLEREVAESWSALEADTPLAYGVAAADPERFEDVRQRMELTLKRRIRLARIAPHLSQPRARLSPLANQLLQRLREKAHVEERIDGLVSQLEVAERIYDMNSQRISDFTIGRQERTLEWVIIVLLAAETLLLLIDLLWTLEI